MNSTRQFFVCTKKEEAITNIAPIEFPHTLYNLEVSIMASKLHMEFNERFFGIVFFIVLALLAVLALIRIAL